MKKLLSIIVLSLCCLAAAAQIRYEEGWFIDNQGVRTDCFIRNTENFCGTDHISYRLSKDKNAETLTAGIMDIKSLYVGETLYERHSFSYDDSSDDANAGYSGTEEPEYIAVTDFLRVVCDGPARLYSYDRHNLKANYFISTEADPSPVYLVDKMFLSQGRTGYVRENAQFRQQLFDTLGDTGVLVSDVKELTYDEKSLIGIFDKSNGTMTAPRRKGILNMDLMGSYRPAKHGSAVGVGVSIEYIMPSNSNKWALYVTPEIKAYSGLVSERDFDSKEKDKYVEFRERQTVAQVTLGGRYYMYPSESVKLYVDMAFGFGAVIGNRGNDVAGFGGVGAADNVVFGAGIKAFDKVAVGVHTYVPYATLFTFGMARGVGNNFFDGTCYPAWPVAFYIKYSIPLNK